MIQTSHRNEWLVTIAVVLTSIILLAALTFALAGNPFERRTREVRIVFPDVTGIRVNSPVRYAGADAGSVRAIRMLSAAERQALSNPDNAVEVSVILNDNVPTLTEGTIASMASDTILADKFVLLTPGPASAPTLAASAVLPGTAPTTIDALSSDLSTALADLRGLLGGDATGGVLASMPAILTEISTTLTEARATLGQANTLIAEGITVIKRGDVLISDASNLVNDGHGLINETRAPLAQLLKDLNQTADTLESFATRAETLVKNNEATLGRSIKNADRAIADLRVAAAHTRILARSLTVRPQQLIWGPRGRVPELPDESEILAD